MFKHVTAATLRRIRFICFTMSMNVINVVQLAMNELTTAVETRFRLSLRMKENIPYPLLGNNVLIVAVV